MTQSRSLRFAVTVGICALLAAASCEPAPAAPRAALAPPPIAAVDGQVMSVNETPAGEYLDQVVRVTVRPRSGEPIVVDLGPGWYLARNGLRFSPDDPIAVQGSLSRSQSVVIASKVRKRNVTVVLRNASGQPIWDSPVPPRP